MWQQMLVLVLLGWIVDAASVPIIANTTVRIETSSMAPQNRNKDSVLISEKPGVRKNPLPRIDDPEQVEQESTAASIPESSGFSGSREAPDQSESSSPMQKNDTTKGSKTDTSTTSVGRGDLPEASSSPTDVKNPENERTAPPGSTDMKANDTQDKQVSVTNVTDSKVDIGNDQKGNENTGEQSDRSPVKDPSISVRDQGAQTSKNNSEKETEGKIDTVISDRKDASTTESSGSSGSFVSPSPNATGQGVLKQDDLPKKITSTSANVTTTETNINDEEFVEPPVQDVDEVADVDIGSQSSAVKHVSTIDENYDIPIMDIQEGKEEFDENAPGNQKKIIPEFDKGGKFSDDEDSHFFAYFLTIIVTAIIFYLIFHNKQRIIALIIEGRAPSTRGRRVSRKVRYHKLDNNLEEAITATKGAKYDRIY